MAHIVLPDHDGQQNNYKNVLGALLQRITGKSMGKTDITFEVVEYGTEFQCTATLVCLDGQQASGELKPTYKDAEQHAALQAVLALEADLKNMGYSISERAVEIPTSVRQAAVAAGIVGEHQNVGEALTDAAIKAMLRTVVHKLLDRELEAGDLHYDFERAAAPGMYNGTLKLPNLPGVLGLTEWKGSDSPFKRDSQLDCSLKALDAILSDPLGACLDLAGSVNVRAPGEKKAKEKAAKREKYAAMFGPLGCGFKGGKGKGKIGKTLGGTIFASKGGKGKGGCSGKAKAGVNNSMQNAMNMQSVFQAGFNAMQGMQGMQGQGGGQNEGWVWMGPGPPPSAPPPVANPMQNMMMNLPPGMMEIFSSGFKFGQAGSMGSNGAFGKGRAKGGKSSVRKRISEEIATGDVVVWREKFGFIAPHIDIDVSQHPNAAKQEGRLYVNAKDVEGGVLVEGQSVTFHVYDDGKGLGAEEVTGF